MVVRVTVVDSFAAGELIRLLVQEVDAEQVRFEPDRQQVCVEIDEHRYLLGARQAVQEAL